MVGTHTGEPPLMKGVKHRPQTLDLTDAYNVL
jgi:hypothetical protein